MELYLHDDNNLQPVGAVRYVVTSGRNQPLAEVLRSHSRHATQLVQANPAHPPGDLLVLRDGLPIPLCMSLFICPWYYPCGLLAHYLPNKLSNKMIAQQNAFHIHVLESASK